ncbi:MAG: hypothetical protein ACOC3V_00730 [bacterium]
MEINGHEWDICSDFLIQNLDFEKLYDRCADISKRKFTKEDIINSIKRLIKEYPHFDRSVKGRIEVNASTLSVCKGYLNGYMYVIDNSYSRGWIMTLDNLFKLIEEQKRDGVHLFIFDTKQYLRTLKLKKICQALTNNTK